MNIDKSSIRRRALQLISTSGQRVATLLAQEFGLSRQVANGYLQSMVRDGLLEAEGTTRSRVYRLKTLTDTVRRYPREGLEEDRVCRELIAPVVARFPKNVDSIWNYAGTEMINNAIDHSGASEVEVRVRKNGLYTEVIVEDEGEGIFRKIQRVLNLHDAREAILELAMRHSFGVSCLFGSCRLRRVPLRLSAFQRFRPGGSGMRGRLDVDLCDGCLLCRGRNSNCAVALFGGVLMSDYWALTKPEVNFLILVTTFAGFYLGSEAPPQHFPSLLLINALLGTVLVASGTATLNQYVERRFDACMRRTRKRPLAAGKLKPSHALWFGMALAVIGTAYLASTVNVLASVIALLTSVSYLVVYTPLKRKTPLCVLAGAFSGAAPPLIGWAAASGTLSMNAWVLYGIVFLWQFPHFMAIAWMYREDYDRAGYLVLPRAAQRNRWMAWQSILPSLALAPVTLAPMLLRSGGAFYGAVALLLSVCFLYYGAQLPVRQTNTAARRLLLASILYLPLIFGLMVLTKA